jgi:hypothetical protein
VKRWIDTVTEDSVAGVHLEAVLREVEMRSRFLIRAKFFWLLFYLLAMIACQYVEYVCFFCMGSFPTRFDLQELVVRQDAVLGVCRDMKQMIENEQETVLSMLLKCIVQVSPKIPMYSVLVGELVF